ncbi:MAG: hypothetical protein ACXVEE_18930 [Polyangiales bacterium]
MSSTRHARFGLIVGAALWASIGCGGSGGDENLNTGDDETGATDDGSLGEGGGIDLDGGLDGGEPCKPRTCADVGANCGPVADGCGGLTADCGSCPAGQVCGGGGTPSVCGTTVGDGGGCVPQDCAKAGANCGPIGDGCGSSIDCGTCAAGLSCGGGGTPSVCGVKYVPADGGMLGDGGTCIKKTCADYPGVNCGYLSDGCGDVVNCGTCTVAGEICGGIKANECGNPYADGGVGGCKPKTCTDLGFNCGLAGDGCGATIDCGTCTSPFICGGGGKPSVCGNSFADDSGVVCKPKTCADYPAVDCGKMADGCGGLTADCGTCTAPYICGGGGVAGKCGNSFADDAGVVCKPKTCADYPGTCGAQSDSCGGLTANCGVCTAPDICGGGGVPSKCGGGTTDGGVISGCTDPLCAKIPICDAGTETSISGTVYAPNGLQPLYNAVVYIPKGTVAPFSDTVTCDRCDTPKPAIASAITGPDGKFTLKGAIPAGTNIPIVIELGKWRRYAVIPSVSACVPNPLPAATTRLPKHQAEGNALDNIPRMALTTGSVDALECVLRKMGIDDVAFGDPTFTDKTKRIHIYKDNGAVYSGSTPSWTTLTSSPSTLANYDAVLWSCRGSEGTARSATDMANLRAYADAGGRVFATHYSYMWIELDPIWKASAVWTRNGGAATASDTTPLRSDVNTGFPKGLAFSQWLNIVGALSVTTPPRVDILVSRKDVQNTAGTSVKWISSITPTAPINTTQHFTFNTPYGAATSALCGRVLFSDFHVANAATSTATTFPAECTAGALTAQEKILEFMLFDLASCVNGDNLPPPPPPTCTPKTCADVGATCGKVADGCGGVTADCGTCGPGTTCGGAGVPGKCGGPTCTKTSCTALGYTCGPAGDGCGGTLDCGTCTVPGETCGGGGVAGKCGGPKCTPQKCTDVGATCGYIGDGCGLKLYCGDCVAPDTCGGGGTPSKCGSPKCIAKTCADYGATCGWVGDGCGDKVFCGDCTTAGESCGGAGITGTCGKPSTTPCTPLTCTALGLSCGPAGDGCGGLLDCGACVAPETCGGGGVTGKCGAPTCTPKTCAGLGYNCGLAADGCGGVLDCGMCTSPASCGGGGTPNVCSGAPR